MLAEVDYSLLVNSITTILLAVITGYFALKAKQFEATQKEQGKEITYTKQLVNSTNTALTNEVKTLNEKIQEMTSDKATLVEQARDKSGDVPRSA
jgi:cell division protein FtsB